MQNGGRFKEQKKDAFISSKPKLPLWEPPSWTQPRGTAKPVVGLVASDVSESVQRSGTALAMSPSAWIFTFLLPSPCDLLLVIFLPPALADTVLAVAAASRRLQKPAPFAFLGASLCGIRLGIGWECIPWAWAGGWWATGGKVPALAVRSLLPTPCHSVSLLARTALHPCPAAPLAALAGGNGNQHRRCPIFCPVMFTWLCWQGCVCGSKYSVIPPLLRAQHYHAGGWDISHTLCGHKWPYGSTREALSHWQRQLLCNLAVPAILWCFYFECFCWVSVTKQLWGRSKLLICSDFLPLLCLCAQ